MKKYSNQGSKDTRSGFGAGMTELGQKNENVVEESKISTNKTYLFLYIWFILMVIVIYVFIIAIVSENSYHPLMNVIIFIFLVYMSYYILNNLSL
jgi:hypothetical protein